MFQGTLGLHGLEVKVSSGEGLRCVARVEALHAEHARHRRSQELARLVRARSALWPHLAAAARSSAVVPSQRHRVDRPLLAPLPPPPQSFEAMRRFLLLSACARVAVLASAECGEDIGDVTSAAANIAACKDSAQARIAPRGGQSTLARGTVIEGREERAFVHVCRSFRLWHGLQFAHAVTQGHVLQAYGKVSRPSTLAAS